MSLSLGAGSLSPTDKSLSQRRSSAPSVLVSATGLGGAGDGDDSNDRISGGFAARRILILRSAPFRSNRISIPSRRMFGATSRSLVPSAGADFGQSACLMTFSSRPADSISRISVAVPSKSSLCSRRSDRTDGAFSPAVTAVVDRSLAASLCDCDAGEILNDPCRWDCPSPVAGRGVYDAQQWAVVFKHSTVDVPSGVTITFGMHPSGAPAVWLATRNVTISGTLNLDGEGFWTGNPVQNPPIIPYYTRPGAGGFQGGQHSTLGQSEPRSFGLGPGSSPTYTVGRDLGTGASYATVSTACFREGSSGATYGNAGIVPLIGGSGGNSSQTPGAASGAAGGAGGGAMLIVSDTQVSLASSGVIRARGGDDSSAGNGSSGGPGSGGAIRLRSETVSLASGSLVSVIGGFTGSCAVYGGSNGRVRVEANTITNLGTIEGSQSFPGAPSVVFPTAPPQLYVTSVCGQSAPTDPT